MGFVLRLAYVLAGCATMAMGIALAGFMTVAALSEVLANDFFGVAVSAMVAVFGMQITKIGFQVVHRARLDRLSRQPMRRLAESA